MSWVKETYKILYPLYPLCRNLFTSKAVLNVEQCSIGNQWGFLQDVSIPSGVGNDSSKTIVNTLQLAKIKGRETPKQGISVVKSAFNQSIHKIKRIMTYEIASKML